jgi:hypothetical protein
MLVSMQMYIPSGYLPDASLVSNIGWQPMLDRPSH